jgi:hypothetical protein
MTRALSHIDYDWINSIRSQDEKSYNENYRRWYSRGWRHENATYGCGLPFVQMMLAQLLGSTSKKKG